MKTILLLALFIAAGTHKLTDMLVAGRPQQEPMPTFTINLKYNSDYERYDVYAQTNFTQQRFLLGPSQISIVVPRQVADQPLAIYSNIARWTDYSSLYAPAAAPDMDFHGVHSLGQSIDVQKDTPFVLFSFSLKGEYVDGVRLYINGKDPASVVKGMMGGDFANTLQNHKSRELFHAGFTQTDLAQLTAEDPKAENSMLSVYPNPITGDAVTVTVRQFSSGERVKLRLFSSTGVEFYGLEEDADKLVNYRLSIPKQLSGQAYLYAERTTPTPGQRAFCKKLIILH